MVPSVDALTRLSRIGLPHETRTPQVVPQVEHITILGCCLCLTLTSEHVSSCPIGMASACAGRPAVPPNARIVALAGDPQRVGAPPVDRSRASQQTELLLATVHRVAGARCCPAHGDTGEL